MSESRDLIYLFVEAERLRQDRLYGEQNHSDEWWNIIVGEEVGEVARAIYEGNQAEVTKELIECAAVIVAWLENRYRKPVSQTSQQISERAHRVIQETVSD